MQGSDSGEIHILYGIFTFVMHLNPRNEYNCNYLHSNIRQTKDFNSPKSKTAIIKQNALDE
jgi:hypothetical protein